MKEPRTLFENEVSCTEGSVESPLWLDVAGTVKSSSKENYGFLFQFFSKMGKK